MNEIVKLDIDYKELETALNEHMKKKFVIARRMMGKVASEIKKETKATKLKGQVLNKVTGKLSKMIVFKTYKDMTATISAKAFYASWHEEGIGKFPARPFLKPVVDEFFSTNRAEEIMDKVLQDALDKLYGENK